MAIRVRTTRNQEEYAAALGGIGHYFGGGWTPEETQSEFGRNPAARAAARRVRRRRDRRRRRRLPVRAHDSRAGSFPAPASRVVGVLPTHRRQGILGRMMRAQLDDIRERGEPLAALWASEETIYGRFGYGLASQDVMVQASRVHAELQRGPADASGRRGSSATTRRSRPSRGSTTASAAASPGFVSRSTDLVGASQARRPPRAPAWSGRAEPPPARDRRPAGRIRALPDQARVRGCDEQEPGAGDRGDRGVARSRPASSGATCSQSTGGSIESTATLPADHPLFLLVRAPEPLDWKVFDGLWLRLVDVGAALAARSLAADGRVTFELHADPMLPDNVGHLDARSRPRAPLVAVAPTSGSTCRRSRPPTSAASRSPTWRAPARRRGRAGRHRPGRRALPRRREAVVPRDLLSRNRTRIATATGPSESALRRCSGPSPHDAIGPGTPTPRLPALRRRRGAASPTALPG